MSQQKNKNHSLNNDLDPEFDLDQYIDEQAGELPTNESPQEVTPFSYRAKNSLILVAAFTAVFLWAFEWSPQNAYSYFFGESTEMTPQPVQNQGAVASTSPGGFNISIPPINIEIPDIDIEIPEFQSTTVSGNNPDLGMSFTDYMAKLNELGYMGDFGSSSLRSLYRNNVPVNVIDQYGQAGMIDDFGGSGISRLYNNQVPFEYVAGFKQSGIIDEFGSTSISRLYNNKVPLEYILQFDQVGLLDEFGSTSISRLYGNEVPVNYINEIAQAGLLDEFGSTSISRLYQNNVPLSFLRELDERGLLENMSSTSIVEAYNIDG